MRPLSVDQGTQEWKDERARRFSASTMGQWLIEEPKLSLTVDEIKGRLKDLGILAPKGALRPDLVALLPEYLVIANSEYSARRNDAWRDVIFSRIEGLSNDVEPEFDNWWTKQGKLREPLAREAYAKEHDVEVIQAGFIVHDSDDFGCSPDGLVPLIAAHQWLPENFRNGWEGKCHRGKVHGRFLDEGGFREEHEMQCQVSMAATGIREWHLYGWHPELPPLKEVFQWDAKTDRVLAGLLQLSADYRATLERFKVKYEDYYNQPT